MHNQAFSKIWIIIVLVILIGGVILAWQYLRAPKEEVFIPKELVEETIGSFMEYRINTDPELYSYLPDDAETVKLKYVTVLASFSDIVLTAPDLERYEVVKGKETSPGKLQFTVKPYMVREDKDLGYYNEEIVMEKLNDKYLITSFKQGEYNSIIEDPCQDLDSFEKRNACYYHLAEETKNAEFCGKLVRNGELQLREQEGENVILP